MQNLQRQENENYQNQIPNLVQKLILTNIVIKEKEAYIQKCMKHKRINH